MKNAGSTFDFNVFGQVRQNLLTRDNAWFRYDAYELIKNEYGGILIIPKKNSRQISYHPRQDPNILQDFLKLGKFLDDTFMHFFGTDPEELKKSHYSADDLHVRTANAVLRFCSKYGLLGFLMEEDIFRDKQDGYYFLTRVGRYLEKRKYYDFVKTYFPRLRPANIKPIKPTRNSYYYREYAEDPWLIAIVAWTFYDWAKLWKHFCTTKPNLTDGIDRPLQDFRPSPWEGVDFKHGFTWQNFFSFISVDDISLVLRADETPPKIDFCARSLQASLKIQFLLSITAADKYFRLCDECSTPFIAKDPRAKFCGDRCSTRSRQRRFSEKHNAKESSSKSGVKTGVELSRKAGKSQGKSRKPIKRQNPRG
jgi:hypothetical protein